MFHTLSVGFRYKQELPCPAQLNHQWKKNYQNLLIVLLQFKRYCRFVFAEGYKSAKSLCFCIFTGVQSFPLAPENCDLNNFVWVFLLILSGVFRLSIKYGLSKFLLSLCCHARGLFAQYTAFISFAPVPHSVENRFQALPQFCQGIFYSWRNFSIYFSINESVFFHITKLSSQNLLRNAADWFF